MTFRWSKIKKPVYILAPMANITNLPFRSICKEMGADIVFTPMFSANALIHNPDKTLRQARFLKNEQPVVVQIFGYDGKLIARAANIVKEQLKPVGIDINMGCPAPKITKNASGSALLKDYDHALQIAKTVRNKFDGQLSVKIRLGWAKYDVLDFAKALEKIGIDAISVHGRTVKQGYSGAAEWESINEIADSLRIPVIGNGDIITFEDALERTKNTKLAGAMIGRGALGNPWLFKSIRQKREVRPSVKELKKIILKQAKLSISYLGDESLAMRELRKHLGWYLKSIPNIRELRARAMRVETLNELKLILGELK